MAGCGSCCAETQRIEDTRWRRVLWIALAINVVMFAGEIGAGIASGSRSLQADALDYLGDAANYAISLGVAGMALGWRSRAALLKGGTILAFGLYVLVTTVLAALGRGVPQAAALACPGLFSSRARRTEPPSARSSERTLWSSPRGFCGTTRRVSGSAGSGND